MADVSGKKETQHIKWTEEETALLFQITMNYKVAKMADEVTWDTVKSKHVDICKNFVDAYPNDVSECTLAHFPHAGNAASIFDSRKIKNKMCKLKAKYNKICETSKKSGAGRIGVVFYDEMVELWSGSPAAEKLACPLSTSDVCTENTSSGEAHEMSPSASEQNLSREQSVDESDFDEQDAESRASLDDSEQQESSSSAIPAADNLTSDSGPKTAAQKAADLVATKNVELSNFLDDRRHKKMSSQLPRHKRLSLAEEENLKIKRRQLDLIADANKQHNEHMASILNVLVNISNAVTASQNYSASPCSQNSAASNISTSSATSVPFQRYSEHRDISGNSSHLHQPAASSQQPFMSMLQSSNITPFDFMSSPPPLNTPSPQSRASTPDLPADGMNLFDSHYHDMS